MVGDIEDVVIGFFGGEIPRQIGVKIPFELNADFSQFRTERDAAVEDGVFAEGVQSAYEFTGMAIEGLVAFLELIELFHDRDGNDNVVLFELVKATAVVEDDIGIKDKELLFPWHLGLFRLAWDRFDVRRRGDLATLRTS